MFVTEQEDKEWKVGQKTNSEHYHVFPVFLDVVFCSRKEVRRLATAFHSGRSRT